jgi:hypothetical protein
MPPGLAAIRARRLSTSTAKWFGKRSRTLPDFEMFPVEFGRSVDAEGRLVVEQRGTTKGKGSGLTTAIDHAAVYTFSGGKVLAVKEYNTFGEALESVGLSE